MKRLVNYRVLFFISIMLGALILGICEINRQNYFWGILCLMLCCLVAGVIIFFKKRLLNIALISALCFCCLISVFWTINFWEAKSKIDGEIIFTLTDDINSDEDILTAVGKDIKVNGAKISGKVWVRITLDNNSYLYNLKAGDKLLIYSGFLNPQKLFKNNSVNYEQYRNDIKYTLNCTEYDVRRYSGKIDALSYIRGKLKQIVFDNIKDFDTASVAYAMITGEKAYISDQLTQNYKTSGLAHILAVSGMNISFLIICISFLFSRIKGLRFFKLLITSIIIIFYCAICGFVPSVARAGIMGILLLVSKATGQRHDSLNSLGFASIVLLLIKPLYIYDVSFLLSFACVFSIICLYSPIANMLKKLFKGKLGNYISELISMTLSANIGIYPLMAYYFNSFSLYSLPFNIVLLPLVNIAFVLLFAGCIISLVVPILGLLVKPSGWIIWTVNKATYLIKNFKYANIIIFSLGGLAIIYYLGIFVLGGYINIPNKLKAISVTALAVFFGLLVTFTNIASVYKENTFTAFEGSYPIGIITTSDNSRYLVGEINDYNYRQIRKELINKKIRNLDRIIITKTPYTFDALIQISTDFSADEIVIVTDDWALCDEIEVSSKINVIQIFDNIDYTIKGLKIYSYSYNGARLGTKIISNQKSILFPIIKDEKNSKILNTLIGGTDIIVSKTYNQYLDFMLCLVYDKIETPVQNVINMYEKGNFAILL